MPDALPSSPAARLPLLRDFGDWLSPMVVKELRHGLRTRFFTTALIGFHWLLILLMASVLIGTEAEMVNGTFWILAFVLLLGVLPLRGFATLAGESKDGTLDMLTLTSISSWKITFGKWAALFSQNFLVGVSLLPYLVARYQFGGVEVVREMVALGLLMLVSAIATAMFVGFSSQSSIVLRLFLAAGTLIAAIPAGVMIYLVGLGNSGDNLMQEWLDLNWVEQGMVAGLIFGLAAYAVAFFLAMGASRIAPPSENHSTIKRLMMLGVVSALAIIGVAICFLGDPDMTYWAFVPAVVITVLAGMDLMTEDTPRFPTVVLPFVKRGRWSQLSGLILYPGWASGLRLYLVLVALTFAIFHALTVKDSPDWGEEGLGLACFLLAPIVPIVLPWGRNNLLAGWWWTQGTLVVAGILLTVLCGVSRIRELGFLGVVTPTTALFSGAAVGFSREEEVFAIGVAIGLIWLVAALVKATAEGRVYRGLEWEAKRMLDNHRTATTGGESDDEPA